MQSSSRQCWQNFVKLLETSSLIKQLIKHCLRPIIRPKVNLLARAHIRIRNFKASGGYCSPYLITGIPTRTVRLASPSFFEKLSEHNKSRKRKTHAECNELFETLFPW